MTQFVLFVTDSQCPLFIDDFFLFVTDSQCLFFFLAATFLVWPFSCWVQLLLVMSFFHLGGHLMVSMVIIAISMTIII